MTGWCWQWQWGSRWTWDWSKGSDGAWSLKCILLHSWDLPHRCMVCVRLSNLVCLVSLSLQFIIHSHCCSSLNICFYHLCTPFILAHQNAIWTVWDNVGGTDTYATWSLMACCLGFCGYVQTSNFLLQILYIIIHNTCPFHWNCYMSEFASEK